MPAGLDGNPRPIRTFERDAVLSLIADRVCSDERHRVLVGIDGRSGSGKSTLGGELAAHLDEPTDTAREHVVDVATDAVLVFDGLFLHRPEFAAFWDISVFLDADERRDTEWLQYLLANLPDDVSQRSVELDRRLDSARWPRYRRGWDRYIGDVAPRSRATVVVDNNDLSQPRVLEQT